MTSYSRQNELLLRRNFDAGMSTAAFLDSAADDLAGPPPSGLAFAGVILLCCAFWIAVGIWWFA